MLGTGWTEVAALAAAYLIAVVTTPAGISGAVLLLPFQVSVLGTPSPSVTPTNLLYNIVATPGALYRYWRQGQTGGRLALVLIAGTLPGVVAGSFIRVELLPGPRAFDVVVAAVLIPLGGWLARTRPSDTGPPDTGPSGTGPSGTGPPGTGPSGTGPPGTGRSGAGTASQRVWSLPAPALASLAVVVGCVGGIYGIGGGAILAPVLIGTGRKPSEVAPAALAATFVTSAGGVIAFTILSLQQHISVAPDWPTGIALGLGGLAGGYTGARLQSRMPDLFIRRLIGVLVIAIGAYYLSAGLG